MCSVYRLCKRVTNPACRTHFGLPSQLQPISIKSPLLYKSAFERVQLYF